MKCPQCGTDNRDGVTTCVVCGTDLSPQRGSFSPPNTPALPSDPYMPYPQYPTSSKSKATAGILALLLGSFGAHKFYLSQPGMGILYLLFCWTGIPTIIGFIEGIVYLSMSERDFAIKYH